jgi:uncharacterized membrane protein
MATQTETNVLQTAQHAVERGLRQTGIERQSGEFNEQAVARFLGWFSIGLGAAELVAPRLVARISGTRNHSNLIRSYGLREMAAGVGILTMRRPTAWLWARVAGDAVDLASLGSALGSRRNNRAATAAAIGAVAGITVLDVICARKMPRPGHRLGQLEASVTVGRPPEECYRFWRNFENLPRFLEYVESVRPAGERRSHWVACGPGGNRFEWDAEVTEDLPGRRIGWRSTGGGNVSHSGSVEFEEAPGDRGTVVRARIELQGLGRLLAAAPARLIGKHPEQMVYKDLRRFKSVMETGEALTTDGQPAGRRSGATWMDRMAQ